METDIRHMIGDPSVQIHKPKEKTTGLTFEEAIVAIKSHKRIRRNSWINTYYYIDKENLYLYPAQFNLTLDEVLENDWEIAE